MLIELIVPLFLLIMLGYFLKKSNFLNEEFGSKLNKFVFYVALPVMLFTKTMNVQLDFSVALFLGYPLIILIMVGLAFLLSIKLKKHQKGAFIQNCFRSNMGYLGLPIILILLTDSVASYAAVILGIAMVLHTVLTIAILETLNVKTNNKDTLISIVKNPLIIAIVLGFLVSFLQITFPIAINETLEMLSRVALPLILITIGISLDFREVKKNLFLSVVGTATKLLVMPLVAFLTMFYVFGVTGPLLLVVVLFAGMPTAISSYTFTKEFNSDEILASTTINLTTLLSLVTIPIIAFLLGVV